jgi:hypothetical protein
LPQWYPVGWNDWDTPEYRCTGLICGLIGGFVGGLSDRVKTDKVSPNQGIKLSRENSLAAFLATWLIAGLTYRLTVDIATLGEIIWLGSVLGLFIGLNRGDSAVIQRSFLGERIPTRT